MKHYERTEKNWRKFKIVWPYEKALKRFKKDALAKYDFDTDTLFLWGAMEGVAILQVLKDMEREFGEKGQKAVQESFRKTGYKAVMQSLGSKPKDLSDAEIVSFITTVINRIYFCSIEDARVDSENQVSFDIIWCPYEDLYNAFDCRVQRYFVQGMLDALYDKGWFPNDWQIRVDCTMPNGAEKCKFVLWRGSEEEKKAWAEYTQKLERRALQESQKV